MASSRKETALAEIIAALEAFTGHKIDQSPQQIKEQLLRFSFPFSTYAFTPASSGEVVSRSIFVEAAPFCNASELLDVSSSATTGDSGNVTFLITNFLCPNEQGRYYSEPVNIVATPVSASPFFVTVTHSLVITPPNTSATNVQITIYAWDASGAPAPGVQVNWRCRVPTLPIIQ
jgi:hypothetical protein